MSFPRPNLNGLHGAIRFWFSPDWNGGTGPGAPGYLFEVGDVYSPGGGWALETDPNGTGLSFVSGSNGMLTTYLSAPIGGWQQGQWHQIVLNYSSNQTVLFIDGAPAARWIRDRQSRAGISAQYVKRIRPRGFIPLPVTAALPDKPAVPGRP